MPPFTKPFNHKWTLSTEKKALQKLQKGKHGIPKPKRNQLLMGTWNIANFDVQRRDKSCYYLIAEIIKPFDLMAVQEVNANLSGIKQVMKILGSKYDYIFTDVAGNEERLCYIFKHDKIKPAEQIGELAIPPSRKIYLNFKNKNGKKVRMDFKGFDRTHYAVSWNYKKKLFTTYNCHLYFGASERRNVWKFRRRVLEAYAMVKWIGDRLKRHREKLFSTNIIILGDMNVPKMKKTDPVYKQLLKRNMKPVSYDTHMDQGSNLTGDKYYDQLVVAEPFSTKIKLDNYGIFAFDTDLFRSLWNKVGKDITKADFRRYMKWAVSDHRVLWSTVQIK